MYFAESTFSLRDLGGRIQPSPKQAMHLLVRIANSSIAFPNVTCFPNTCMLQQHIHLWDMCLFCHCRNEILFPLFKRLLRR